MPRVTPLSRSELDPDFLALRDEAEKKGGDVNLAGVVGRVPELFRSYFRFYYPAHESGRVETRIKELARLKIARLNGCLACGNARYESADAQGVDEALISQLDLPEAEQSFNARERLAIRFAEKLALDHQSIDDAFFAELRNEFSDDEVVELGMMIGQYLGFGRLLVALGLEPEAGRSRPYAARPRR